MTTPMAKTVLEKFKAFLKENVGVEALLDPQPATLQEPHFRIMPVGFSFRSEEINETVELEQERTTSVKLDILLTLRAQGDGPDVFLDKVLNASYKIGKMLERGMDFEVNDSISAGMIGERRPGGQFFQNEGFKEGEAGQMPFLYEESFNVSLYFPYKETI